MKVTNPLGGLLPAIVNSVRPITIGLEVLSDSAEHFATTHAKDLASRRLEEQSVRKERDAASLQIALAKASQRTVDANAAVREAQVAMAVDTVQGQVHAHSMEQIVNLPADTIAKLANRRSVTKADILKAANIQQSADAIQSEASDIADELDAAETNTTAPLSIAGFKRNS